MAIFLTVTVFDGLRTPVCMYSWNNAGELKKAFPRLDMMMLAQGIFTVILCEQLVGYMTSEVRETLGKHVGKPIILYDRDMINHLSVEQILALLYHEDALIHQGGTNFMPLDQAHRSTTTEDLVVNADYRAMDYTDPQTMMRALMQRMNMIIARHAELRKWWFPRIRIAFTMICSLSTKSPTTYRMHLLRRRHYNGSLTE